MKRALRTRRCAEDINAQKLGAVGEAPALKSSGARSILEGLCSKEISSAKNFRNVAYFNCLLLERYEA